MSHNQKTLPMFDDFAHYNIEVSEEPEEMLLKTKEILSRGYEPTKEFFSDAVLCISGHAEDAYPLIHLLLNNPYGPSVNPNIFPDSPALYFGGYPEFKKMCEDTGFDINFKDEKGETALSTAVRRGDFEEARTLVEEGAR